MRPNKNPIIPRCGLCKKLYSSKVDDGSGLCLKCRPIRSEPIIISRRNPKQKANMKGAIHMDEFDEKTIEKTVTSIKSVENETAQEEISIEDIIQPGRYGVSNTQMIPAIKKAIQEESIDELVLLKKHYFYTFEKSIRYLRKAEREFIKNKLQ